jgi:hypothetical protein
VCFGAIELLPSPSHRGITGGGGGGWLSLRRREAILQDVMRFQLGPLSRILGLRGGRHGCVAERLRRPREFDLRGNEQNYIA